MEATEVKEYIEKLPESLTSSYIALSPTEQDKQIFFATEMLTDFYGSKVTARTVALQLLFILESEGEEFARLKRHGVQSMSTKDTSVQFASSHALSPDVVAILGEPILSKGYTGRLI
jgi:hypothetical protein